MAGVPRRLQVEQKTGLPVLSIAGAGARRRGRQNGVVFVEHAIERVVELPDSGESAPCI